MSVAIWVSVHRHTSNKQTCCIHSYYMRSEHKEPNKYASGIELSAGPWKAWVIKWQLYGSLLSHFTLVTQTNIPVNIIDTHLSTATEVCYGCKVGKNPESRFGCHTLTCTADPRRAVRCPSFLLWAFLQQVTKHIHSGFMSCLNAPFIINILTT